MTDNSSVPGSPDADEPAPFWERRAHTWEQNRLAYQQARNHSDPLEDKHPRCARPPPGAGTANTFGGPRTGAVPGILTSSVTSATTANDNDVRMQKFLSSIATYNATKAATAAAEDEDRRQKFILDIATSENAKAATICNEDKSRTRISVQEYDVMLGNKTRTEPAPFAPRFPDPSRPKFRTLEPHAVASGPGNPFKWTGKNTPYIRYPDPTSEEGPIETIEEPKPVPKTYGWTPINVPKPKPSRWVEIRVPIPAYKAESPYWKYPPRSPVSPGYTGPVSSRDTTRRSSTTNTPTTSRAGSRTTPPLTPEHSPIDKNHIAAISGLDFSQMYAWRMFPEEQKQMARENVLREYPHWTDDEVEARLKRVTTSRNMSSARKQKRSARGEPEKRENRRRKTSQRSAGSVRSSASEGRERSGAQEPQMENERRVSIMEIRMSR
ncbi:Protein of unknown function [Pyronema omphalodes CBS 100304]|uniref:Uncharacterized protein n=1 Tax=Pyronema omphalodes (strain CBS 100304) TaxID=1076935 RepID=U4LNM6_PYROM|nr:Protein of unknown function [Pyronema omphalodes CBS 100304]